MVAKPTCTLAMTSLKKSWTSFSDESIGPKHTRTPSHMSALVPCVHEHAINATTHRNKHRPVF